MADYLHQTNFAFSTLAAQLLIAGTDLQVAAGEGLLFPHAVTADHFPVVIWDAAITNPSNDPTREIVHAHYASADHFLIVRAQEGTSAKQWEIGDKVALVLTAAKLGELEVEIDTKYPSAATQTANYVFAGPVSGAAAVPTFRAVVAADLGTTLTLTLAGLIVPGISPAANFILTQNSVAVLTSIGASAVVNTLYLKEGSVGSGTAAPNTQLHLDNALNIGPQITLSAPSGGTPGIIFRPFQAPADWGNPAQASITAADASYSADIHFYTKTPGAAANALVERMAIFADGVIRIASLAGTGTRAVVADANGNLSAP